MYNTQILSIDRTIDSDTWPWHLENSANAEVSIKQVRANWPCHLACMFRSKYGSKSPCSLCLTPLDTFLKAVEAVAMPRPVFVCFSLRSAAHQWKNRQLFPTLAAEGKTLLNRSHPLNAFSESYPGRTLKKPSRAIIYVAFEIDLYH